ncbi:DUF418 domain-containing protein [Aestuariivivens sediminis]|uniref:DUF418 domain-containing protein n=1 Tax=Aestuariivivens sediminis TaxID=2913557 RepID=UPI003B849056
MRLFQTLLFTALFYGYGLGKGLDTGPFGVTLYAILFFTLQIVACNWWARYFRFGPVEWIWRCISYSYRVSIKRQYPPELDLFRMTSSMNRR